MGDDLTKIGDRLKEGKDLLNEDLSSKPWLKYIAQRKISRKESLERVSEDSSPAYDNGSDCKKVPREVCDQCETKTLQPACLREERVTCGYQPVTECKVEAKNYCYKAEVTKMVEVCDDKLATNYL